MAWTAALYALIKALPSLIALIRSIQAAASARSSERVGYDRAVNEMLSSVQASIKTASNVENDAALSAATHTDDTAFDNDFRRD